MLHFFRKIRRDLLAKSQLFKYLKYAVGEIVLVVLGILIALYINNENEKRKEQEKFNQVLVEVKKELENNISSSRETLKFYATADSMFLKIFIDSMQSEGYDQKKLFKLQNLGYHYSFATIKAESYEKLIEINGVSKDQEEILNEINHLYGSPHDDVNELENHVREQILRNLRTIETYEWYSDWLINQNDKYFEYFLNHSEYYNSMSSTYVMYVNYSINLQTYNVYAVSTFKKIIGYLDRNNIEHSETLELDHDLKEFDSCLGAYKSKWCTDNYFSHRDSAVINIKNGKLMWTSYYNESQFEIELIPINKYVLGSDIGGMWHLKHDNNGKVNGMRFRLAPAFVLDFEKIR